MPTRLAAAVPGGGLPSLPPAYPPSVYFPAPYSPPPFPGGEGGGPRLFHARGCAPCIPGVEPRAAPEQGANHAPGGGVPSESPTRRKTDRTAFLLAVPAAKERGDRGRGTSAFEMVLSPGAGIASAAGGLPSLPPAYPPPVYFPAPYSPPLPRRGRGDQGYFMQGAAPLASPGLNPGGTGAGGRIARWRGCAFGIANSPQNR